MPSSLDFHERLATEKTVALVRHQAHALFGRAKSQISMLAGTILGTIRAVESWS
jgi:hypothetical protein